MRQTRGPVDQHVLLVEDEHRLSEMLQRALREMGYHAAGVASAEQAMRLMQQRAYPVVIIDLNLPGAGGLDLLRSIREQWPDTQAVILTGFGDLNAARQAIHLDVVDFLTKPCALGDLEIALARAFRRLNHELPSNPVPEEDGPDDEESLADERRPASRSGTPLEFTPREGNAGLSLEEVERQTILAVLERHGGSRAAAASELGISIRKLYYRLAQYQNQPRGK